MFHALNISKVSLPYTMVTIYMVTLLTYVQWRIKVKVNYNEREGEKKGNSPTHQNIPEIKSWSNQKTHSNMTLLMFLEQVRESKSLITFCALINYLANMTFLVSPKKLQLTKRFVAHITAVLANLLLCSM